MSFFVTSTNPGGNGANLGGLAGADAHCQSLAERFIEGGIKVDLTETVVGERWRKCLWNTPFNPFPLRRTAPLSPVKASTA